MLDSKTDCVKNFTFSQKCGISIFFYVRMVSLYSVNLNSYSNFPKLSVFLKK